MKKVQLKVKVLDKKNAIIPKYAKEGDAGFDLFTSKDTLIPPQGTKVCKTGLAVSVETGHEIQIRNRSGITINGVEVYIITFNDDLTLNKSLQKEHQRVILGTLDEGYRGEIGIMTHNESNNWILIPKHTKLAQCVVNPIVQGTLEVVDELDKTERGNSGFGSTGTTNK